MNNIGFPWALGQLGAIHHVIDSCLTTYYVSQHTTSGTVPNLTMDPLFVSLRSPRRAIPYYLRWHADSEMFMSHVQHPKSVKYIGSDKNHTNSVEAVMVPPQRAPANSWKLIEIILNNFNVCCRNSGSIRRISAILDPFLNQPRKPQLTDWLTEWWSYTTGWSSLIGRCFFKMNRHEMMEAKTVEM